MYDVGKVVKGEVINVKFNVENMGESLLIFGDVKGFCFCMVVDWMKDLIVLGKIGVI